MTGRFHGDAWHSYACPFRRICFRAEAAALANELTYYQVREITVRGGLLAPLAAQLNHDMTHWLGQQTEDIFDRLDNGVRKRADPAGHGAGGGRE